MFWYSVIYVLNRLGFFRLYLKVCETVLDLAVWEDEAKG